MTDTPRFFWSWLNFLGVFAEIFYLSWVLHHDTGGSHTN